MHVEAKDADTAHDEDERLRRSAEAALDADPSDAKAWSILGILLRRAGKLEEAIACHRRGLEHAPDNGGLCGNLWTNLGNALTEAGRLAEGVAAQEEAFRRAPGNRTVLFNRVVAFRKAGRYADALAAIDLAIGGNGGPTPLLRWERALTRLQIGDYVHGFDDYEARRQIPSYHARPPSAPPWDGQPLDGRRVFVTTEQGFGDALLVARYLPMVRAAGGRLIYECHSELRRVLSGLVPDEWMAWGAPAPPCDVEVSQMALPMLFRTTLASVPPPVPLTVPAEARDKATWRLGVREPGTLRVGIVWSGRSSFADNARRATRLTPFLGLAEIPGVRLYSLQKGPPEAELDALGPAGRLVVPLGPHMEDFADTAAMIERLDLVVMTDSSVAHLTGSLGTPVWNLVQHVPYWIYGFTGERTPWYPSMRLFRQGPDLDWAPVFARVREALHDEVRRRAVHGAPTGEPS
ncbi:tetratricopeptide repeat protein [Azospirillum agricola]|uniref:tetratricopeptide repeat protein n=1 Tax=Azospirillum agricola TaxID=1720247 RepID=UPI000A0F3BCB|nr:glycosyltransferase [Azospirillum agricola]SMH61882.1 Tetratricopeptide repeat-containing protein [Azospirillum lipoferum]